MRSSRSGLGLKMYNNAPCETALADEMFINCQRRIGAGAGAVQKRLEHAFQNGIPKDDRVE